MTLINREQTAFKPFLRFFIPIGFIAFAILALTYFTPNGGVSYDGSYYLRLAKSLVEGEGFWVSPPKVSALPEGSFFADRPVGYSIGIAVITFLFNLPVYWGAKVFSILIICGIAFGFYILYGQKGVWLTSIFLFSIPLEIYFQVMTETLFIGILVSLVITIYKGFINNFSWVHISVLTVLACLFFATRYVGIVVLPFLGVFIIYDPYRHTFTVTKNLMIPLAITSIFIAGYFLMNLHYAGAITGYSKPWQSHSFLEVAGIFINENLHQLNFLFSVFYRGAFTRWISTGSALLVQIGILYWLYRYFKPSISFKKLSPVFLIGLIFSSLYILMIFGIYLVKFYHFSFRFLLPPAFLIIWGVFDQFYRQGTPADFRFLKYTMVSFAAISFSVNVLIRSAYHYSWEERPIFPEHLEQVTHKYKKVPANSVVLFPELDLNYLRLDVMPYYARIHKDIDTFKRKIPNRAKPVFLNCCETEWIQFSGKTNKGPIKELCKEKNCVIRFLP